MEHNEKQKCPNCGSSSNGEYLFHELYCYDLYIPSAPEPRNEKQQKIDDLMEKEIVSPLEKAGINVFHGHRDYTGGMNTLESFSKPFRFVPMTLLPIFEDLPRSRFLYLLRNSLSEKILRRVCLLLLHSDQNHIPTEAKNCFSLNAVGNPISSLLPKLKATLVKLKAEFPLSKRKRIFDEELESVATNSEVAEPEVASLHEGFHRSTGSRRSIRFNTKIWVDSTSVEMASEPEDAERSPSRIPPLPWEKQAQEMLRLSAEADESTQRWAIHSLVSILSRNLTEMVCQNNLGCYHHRLRQLLQRDGSGNPELQHSKEKLCCWLLLVVYLGGVERVDPELRRVLKQMKQLKQPQLNQPKDLKHVETSSRRKKRYIKCKDYKDTFTYLAHKHSSQLKHAIFFRIQKSFFGTFGSNTLSHATLLQRCQDILKKGDRTSSDGSSQTRALTELLSQLPWGIQHMFLYAITDKILSCKVFPNTHKVLIRICTKLGKKDWTIYFTVAERVTEISLENPSKAVLRECLDFLKLLWELGTEQDGGKGAQQICPLLQHHFEHLVYHRHPHLRSLATIRLLSGLGTELPDLGGSTVPVSAERVLRCVRLHLGGRFTGPLVPDAPGATTHTWVLRGSLSRPPGAVTVHVRRQETLNDMLATDSTDAHSHDFEAVAEITILLCRPGLSQCMARIWDANPYGPLQFYTLEDGEKLLDFLHHWENRLSLHTITQLLICIADAIKYCHAQNIVHRDITPASFITHIVSTNHNVPHSAQVKLASFLMARKLTTKPSERYCTVENAITHSEQGPYGEHVALRFSAPESLASRTFSPYSDTWMLSCTFYSILLYGRQPYWELNHMDIDSIIQEVLHGHTPIEPTSVPAELYSAVSSNLQLEPDRRSSAEDVQQKMLDFRDLLVMRRDKSVYQVDCRSLPTADEDIEWGFLNNEGQVTLQETMSEVSQDIVKDSIIQGAQLFELACVRMNEWTKQTLQELRNDSILQVQTIICHNLTTQLISEPFRDYGWTLQSNPRQAEGREYKQQLINYLQQVTLALQYLHSLRIIHCDLHCSYVFVNIVTNRVKLGRFGRAAYLQGTISDNMFNPHVYKVAPKNSLQRCPPEVEQLGKYSRASDIFMLADLISDALIPEKWVHGAISPLQIDQQLLDCLEKCRSQNPSRRLKIDSILTALQDFKIRSLMKCDLPFPIPVQLHSTSDKTYVEGEVDQFLPPSNSHYMSIMHDSEEEEDLYYSIAYNPDYMNDSVQPQVGDESVYQCHQPYSEDIYEDINCRWEKVVTEYRNENRLISPDSDSQPPSFTPLCGYQDVGIDRKNRPK